MVLHFIIFSFSLSPNKLVMMMMMNYICYFNKICRYVAWILICKRCKFSEKNCNNSTDI